MLDPVTTVLEWPDCVNVRDLGGLSTADRRRIRPGALIRSDNLDRLTPAGVAAVRASGVSRIVDVRSHWESELFPSPFRGESLCVNRPLDSDDVPYDSDLPLHLNYAALLDAKPALAAAAVGAIADAPPGPVVVHCHEGKDRTGMTVALALRAVGVPPADVVTDYAAASPADPQTMVALLAHLDDQYGDVAAYLRRGGLTDAQLNTLHTRLLE